jgi:hypothetical protein
MLAKMGFKEGSSLGKSNTGLIEPIPLVVKEGRAGITESPKSKKPKVEVKDVHQFNNLMSNKAKDKKVIKMILIATSKTCPSLDERASIKNNELLDDWNEIQKKRESGEISFTFEDFLSKESPERRLLRLEEILLYMRKTHLYCTFCAHTYESYETLLASCPGLWEEDH